MVKLPKFEDLKRMGADFLDSAKSGKLGDMVDKLKSTIESTPKPTDDELTEDPLKQILSQLTESLTELNEIDRVQTLVIKKMQNQLAELLKAIEAQKKPEESTQDEKKPE